MSGDAHVDKVFLLGTPNRGCLESLKILHVGVKKVFRPMRPEVVFTMPAVYQMLPPKGSLLFADAEGRPLDIDLYDPDAWIREGHRRLVSGWTAILRASAGAARRSTTRNSHARSSPASS